MGVLASRDAVVVWADTLVTVNGEPGPHCPKIAINPLAGCLATSAGWKSLGDEADRAMLREADMDSIVPAVAEALRKATPRLAPRRRERQRYSFAGNLYVVAGWSQSFGRMVVWEFCATEFFEPYLSTRCMYPVVQLSPGLTLPPSPGEIAHIAALQAAELQKAGCHVGRLSIATITAHGIVVQAPLEIEPVTPASVPLLEAPAIPSPVPSEGESAVGVAQVC